MTLVAKIDVDNNVLEVHTPRSVVVGEDVDAVQYPRNIFTVWTDAELNAIGYARFREVLPPEGKRSTGTTDAFLDGKIVRTHSSEDNPRYLNKRKHETTLCIKSHRDFVVNAGIEWTLDATTYVVQTDGRSQRNLIGAVVGVNEKNDPNFVQNWRMRDNTIAQLVSTDFKVMAMAVRDHVDACYIHQAVLEVAVAAASDITELEAIDIRSGWPPHFDPGA